MKKGLLSILAGALLVVGCQNYDDQFSALETQINALASTVAGLSQVQSDLTSLANTVNSLQSSVAQTVDAALADGLADIDAAVASLEAATESAASAEDVAAIADAVAENQTDLDDLLANSSVFNGSITINSEATLAAFKSIGKGLNIVNGSVTIDVSTSMSQADVQTVVDNILTVTGDFNYTAAASTIAETTFNNLSGAQSITLKQGGGYQMKTLASASNIFLNDTYKSTVAIIDFRKLASVSTIQDDNGVAGTLKFNKATEIHLSSLVYYPGANLNIQCKKGGVIDLAVLDDLNGAGTQVGASYSLSLDGPSTAGNANIGDGTLTFTNVATVSVAGFIGNTVVGAGVENLTVDGAVAIDISAAADLATANITGALDSDATLTTADTAGPAITFASQDLVTATVAGVVASISAASQSNLETLTITADTKGGATTITGNGDLVNLSTTGAKLGNVALDNNTDLETVTLDHTTSLAADDKGATVSITGNTNMTSLTFSADDVDSLTVTGNTQLATINFAGLKDDGTASGATANVNTNALVAPSFKDAYDATTATDTGSIDAGTSGMKTLVDYAKHLLADNTANIGIYFDTLEIAQEQTTAAGNYADVSPFTDSQSGNTRNAYAYQTAFVADTTPTVRETTTLTVPVLYNALHSNNAVAANEGFTMVYGGVTKSHIGVASTITTLDQLITSINADTTFGSGITVTAAQDANHRSLQNISLTTSAGAAGTVSTAGDIEYSFSTKTGVIAVTAGQGAADIATALAAAITGVISTGTSYAVTTSGTAIVVQRVISNTDLYDKGPSSITYPVVSLLTTASYSTAELVGNAASTGAVLNSDYFVGTTATDLKDLRITIKNNSTAVALSYTITSTGAESALKANDIPHTGYAALVSGTTMTGDAAYVSSFAEITTPGSGTAKVAKDRTGW